MKGARLRLWPQSLGGQLIALLLASLVLAQVASLWLFAGERRGALADLARQGLAQRTASLVELIEATPGNLHTQVVETVSSPFLTYWIADRPSVGKSGDGWADRQLSSLISEELGGNREIHADVSRVVLPPRRHSHSADHHDGDEDDEEEEDARPGRRNSGWFGFWRQPRQSLTLNASVSLADGNWLNMAGRFRLPYRSLTPLFLSIMVMGLAVVLVVAFTVRRLTRPLRDLSRAADRLGRGEDVESLPVSGPLEIQGTIHAFNVMQDRLSRFVRDRTRMLAAISHDLRTPITSLRIRAEFIEDEENRDKIIATLEEMQRMTEATLAFAREDGTNEAPVEVDLGDYLDAMAEDYRAMGQDVSFTPPESRIVLTCRPLSLKRAVRNILDNAIRYGERARMDLAARGGEAVITIADDGPGIPEARLKDVFEPFVRLEESRSEETGGIGLGLAIARSVVHALGGTLTLANGPQKGIVATIALPVSLTS
ncbi:HAMP domain-containing protein [Stappia sp. F7233]|uniref:histidine kinase n=1 Tax=Stappia albiluteola TaxID=2758565 RepID=A0A839AIY2_9HYPH|nr:ATP-binding protein [Stappia albiluteola]MBA5779105.1 HAMP domain-containing protein [Stappia albiluteola]